MNFYEAAKYMDTGREFKTTNCDKPLKFEKGHLIHSSGDTSYIKVHNYLSTYEEYDFELIPEKQYTFQEASKLVFYKRSFSRQTCSGKDTRVLYNHKDWLCVDGITLHEPPSNVDVNSMWTEVTNAMD